MIKVLQGYAMIAVGVKITLLNIPTTSGNGGKQGQPQYVVSTQGSDSLADNISTIFGSSFLSSLQPIDHSFNLSTTEATIAENPEDKVTFSTPDKLIGIAPDDTESGR